MSKQTIVRGIALTLSCVVFCYVLGFYQHSEAAPPRVKKPALAIGQPLASAVVLQTEILSELKAIRALIEKQNDLLQQSQQELSGAAPSRPLSRR